MPTVVLLYCRGAVCLRRDRGQSTAAQ